METKHIFGLTLVGMLIVGVLLGAVSAVAEQTGPDTPYSGGGWAVDSGDNVIENETVNITGAISVSDFSSLTFRNCTLNVQTSPSPYINVDASSYLAMYDVEIIDGGNVNYSSTGTPTLTIYLYGDGNVFHNVSITDTWVQIEGEANTAEATVTDIDISYTHYTSEDTTHYLEFVVGQYNYLYVDGVNCVGYQEVVYVSGGSNEIIVRNVYYENDPHNVAGSWAIGVYYAQSFICENYEAHGVVEAVWAINIVETYIANVSATAIDPYPYTNPENDMVAVVVSGTDISTPSNTMDFTIRNVTADGFWAGILCYNRKVTTNVTIEYVDFENCDNGTVFQTWYEQSDLNAEIHYMDLTNVDHSVYMDERSTSTIGDMDVDVYDSPSVNTTNVEVINGTLTFYYELIVAIENNGLAGSAGRWGVYSMGVMTDDDFIYKANMADNDSVYAPSVYVTPTYTANNTLLAYCDYKGNFEYEIFNLTGDDAIVFEYSTPTILTNIPNTVKPGEYDLVINSTGDVDTTAWEYHSELPTLTERTGEHEGDASLYRPELNATYAITPALIDGQISDGEWTDAEMTRWYYYPWSAHPDGYIYLYAMTTEQGLYFLADVTADNTTEEGDYIGMNFDTNGNGSYEYLVDDGIYATGVGEEVVGMTFDEEPIEVEKGFGPTPNNESDHVFWEMFIPYSVVDLQMGENYTFVAYGYGTLAPEWTYPNWQFINETDMSPVVEEENWTTLHISDVPTFDGNNTLNLTEVGTHYVRIRLSNETGTNYLIKSITVEPYTPVLTYDGETNISVVTDDDGDLTFTILFDINEDTDTLYINVTEDSEYYGWGWNLTVYDSGDNIVWQDEFYNEADVDFEHNSSYTFVFLAIPPTDYEADGMDLNGTFGFTPVAPDGTQGNTTWFNVVLTPEEPGLGAGLLLWAGLAVAIIILIFLVVYVIKKRKERDMRGRMPGPGMGPRRPGMPPRPPRAGGRPPMPPPRG